MAATKKHTKKKVGVGIGVLGIIITGLTLWGDIYPVICPYVSNPARCTEVSIALAKVKNQLDNVAMDGGIILE